MAELGLAQTDLDAAFEADGMAQVTLRLKELCKVAEQTGGAPVSLVGQTTIARQRMNAVAAAVRNYRQFRESETTPTRLSAWPELEELREAFLDRVPEFSILPPPASHQPPRPFGWGSLTVTAGRRGHASFSAVSHAYGARYPADRMRRDLTRLFRPDDAALIYLPVPIFNHYDRDGRLIWTRDYERMVPKTGSRNMSVIAIPHSAISDAAAAAQVIVPPEFATPLARLLRISAEAQAAWVYWVYSCCTPRLRRQLLASFTAWQTLESMKRA